MTVAGKTREQAHQGVCALDHIQHGQGLAAAIGMQLRAFGQHGAMCHRIAGLAGRKECARFSGGRFSGACISNSVRLSGRRASSCASISGSGNQVPE